MFYVNVCKRIARVALLILISQHVTIFSQKGDRVTKAMDSLIATIKSPSAITNDRFKSDVIENARIIDQDGTQAQIQQVVEAVRSNDSNVKRILQSQMSTALNDRDVIGAVKKAIQPGIANALLGILYRGLEDQLSNRPLITNALSANGTLGMVSGITSQYPQFKEYIKQPKSKSGVLIGGIATLARDSFSKTIEKMGGAKAFVQKQFGQLEIVPTRLTSQELSLIKQNDAAVNWLSSKFDSLIKDPKIKREFTKVVGNALMGGAYGAAFAFLGLTPEILGGTADLSQAITKVGTGFVQGALDGASKTIVSNAFELAEYKPNLSGDTAIVVGAKVIASGSQIPSLGTLALTGLTTLGTGAITQLINKSGAVAALTNWFSLDIPSTAFEIPNL